MAIAGRRGMPTLGGLDILADLLLLAVFVGVVACFAHRRREAAQRAALHEALRAHEAELEVRARALARSNEALEQFAYAASHELQEPLRKVATFCELLREEKDAALDEEARAYLRAAVDGARRMQALVRALLDLSRVEGPVVPLQPVDADAALRAALDDLAEAAREAGATITTAPLGLVVADATQLEEVLRNLVGNALKYRAPGRPPTVDIRADRDGEAVTISVRDNGIGIDPAQWEEVFLPFRRLHPEHAARGSGLGLTLCRRIVTRWGGAVDVTSTPGEGSTFRVTLRAAAPRVSSAPGR